MGKSIDKSAWNWTTTPSTLGRVAPVVKFVKLQRQYSGKAMVSGPNLNHDTLKDLDYPASKPLASITKR